jgi:hypothetical protein
MEDLYEKFHLQHRTKEDRHGFIGFLYQFPGFWGGQAGGKPYMEAERTDGNGYGPCR